MSETNAIEHIALDNALWRFSLSVWDNEPVRKALLALQDEFDLNINLILCALWLGESGCSIADPQYNTKQAIAWHKHRVLPIRKQRKAVGKNNLFENLRRSLLDAEVAAEQIELGLFYHYCSKQQEASEDTDTLKYICDNLIYVLKLSDKEYTNKVSVAYSELVGLFKLKLKRSQIDMYFAQVTSS